MKQVHIQHSSSARGGPDDGGGGGGGGRGNKDAEVGGVATAPTTLSSVTIPFVVFLSGGSHTGRVAETGVAALPPQITDITTHHTHNAARERDCDINRE